MAFSPSITHLPNLIYIVSDYKNCLFKLFFQSDLSTDRPIYVGLTNFKMMLEDEVFRKAFINSFWFAVGTIPTSVMLGMLLAILVNRKIKGTSLARTAFFLSGSYPNG